MKPEDKAAKTLVSIRERETDVHDALLEAERMFKQWIHDNLRISTKMCKDQAAQLDCGISQCAHNSGGGYCRNSSPAITLNVDNSFVCWDR